MNKVILFGRLGKDPELTTFDNGNQSCRFSLATSQKRKDKEGNVVENTQWHNCISWGKSAEILQKYLSKGDQILVQGAIRYREHNDKYYTDIIVESFDFVSKPRTQENSQQVAPKQQPHPSTIGQANTVSDEDDLPF